MATVKKKATAKSKKRPTNKAKASSKRKVKSSAKLTSASIENISNPAHSYGHRKMNLKKDFDLDTSAKTHTRNLSATNNVTRADIVARQESPQRRIISGASLNKKGRLV